MVFSYGWYLNVFKVNFATNIVKNTVVHRHRSRKPYSSPESKFSTC